MCFSFAINIFEKTWCSFCKFGMHIHLGQQMPSIDFWGQQLRSQWYLLDNLLASLRGSISNRPSSSFKVEWKLTGFTSYKNLQYLLKTALSGYSNGFKNIVCNWLIKNLSKNIPLFCLKVFLVLFNVIMSETYFIVHFLCIWYLQNNISEKIARSPSSYSHITCCTHSLLELPCNQYLGWQSS